MGQLKKLAGQTIIYGMGTIVPRLLNYLLLTPFYTYIFIEGKYGIVTELYAYIAFLLVLLTYGMETTYFRFSESEENKDKVFSTALTSLITTSFLFVVLTTLFSEPIARLIQYENNSEYIVWLALIVAFDAISAVPYAKLRKDNKALKFVIVKIINVLLNIFLNLLFFVWCPHILDNNPDSILQYIYSENIGVGYAFISNLIASIVSFLILIPDLLKIKFQFDYTLLKRMLGYAFPLLIVGVAGMVNEVADKIFLKYMIVVPEGIANKSDYVLAQVGIYGANYKLAVLMSIFIQMFRFAAEPFFFAQSKDKNAKKTYADVMKFFVIFCLIIFLGVMLYIDIVKFFIGPAYRVGLHIVPIVLFANLFLGIVFNLSIWYKINNMTRFGAYIAILGAVITIILNIILIPLFGYLGSAWATFICYFIMVIYSYYLGQKYYPVNYEIKTMAIYAVFAFVLYAVFAYLKIESQVVSFIVASIFFVSFISFVIYKERLFKAILKL